VIFLALPELEILDLAGPMQAFDAANDARPRYALRTVSTCETIRTHQGLTLANLEPLPEVDESALIVVPGMPYRATGHFDMKAVRWLRRAYEAGAMIASVCSGSFVLGEAGLLDGRRCTTHWSLIDDLQRRFPRARVLADRLFVSDGSLVTSAGIASGIDMALALIERKHGPLAAAEVAREMVVYLRRDGSQEQTSVYLDYRTHLHPGVHKVQDWLVQNPSRQVTLDALAGVGAMSRRNLTRLFRQATGISIAEYRTRVRVELARSLLQDPTLSIENVARRCGFTGARQLRRVWQTAFGASPRHGSRPGSQGNSTRNVVPEPARDSNVILPP
jgi:transcriptional regulator GlxA family with amidase domain